jgi:hypothetical protein
MRRTKALCALLGDGRLDGFETRSGRVASDGSYARPESERHRPPASHLRERRDRRLAK